MLKILPTTIFFQFLVLIQLEAQQTNTRAIGRALSEDNEILAGTTITAIHTPTEDKYISIANSNGYFSFFNLKPGGPYTLIFSSTGYDTLKQTNLFVHLGSEHFLSAETEIIEFNLQRKIMVMEELIFSAPKITRIKSGVETNISAFTLKSMPSISRSFQDYIRLVPQAKVNGDGVISLAGQNNRFNAFFIDGASNSDLQGVAANGMNGGQTGSSPVSIEAIEEINILQAPYDVQYGNFTGGTINAITRSGSNENKSSAWYFFRNENLAGRSPVPLKKQDAPGEYSYPRLPGFANQTIGAWNSGALIKNKLFYFVLFETQSERRPQVFNMDEYDGNSNQQQLFELTNFVKTTYKYDPGSFIETKDDLDATRVNIKLDWNVSVKDKITLSYRYNNAERTMPRLPNSANSIAFQNNGIKLQDRTNAAAFEWKRFIKNNMNNRMLLTFTNQLDHRKGLGQPFPTVVMTDGTSGNVTLGTDGATAVNKFKASDFALFDALMVVIKKHTLTTGIEINYTALDNMSIPNYYGQYNYRSVVDFINVAQPSRYQRTFPLTETTENPAKFNTLRSSFFINDEIRTGANLKMNFGLRVDMNSIQSKPPEDKFFNDSAVQIISGYYNTAGAVSGQPMSAHWNLSPRISLDYKLAKYNINLRGGAGLFLGHIVNFWQYDVFNINNGGNIDVNNPLRFEPDPFHQPTYQELRTYPYRDLIVMAGKFKYPTVFRTSLVVEKQFKNRWSISIEGIFTKNIHEAAFQNINIVPPLLKSSPPGSRNIYSTSSSPDKIAFSSTGIQNPYSGVYLITNNSGKKGSAYSLSFNVQKQAKTLSFNSSYTYGNSNTLFEITGPQTPARAQWRNMETVNGRNFTGLSTSDNALQHRIIGWVTKTFTYAKKKASTSVSLFYNGQSGSAYSYVYNNSMINDNGKRNENFDLVYIPTINEVGTMSFLPIIENNQVIYTAEEQAYSLNSFIESDKYLKKHRGEFAKRNGARLPFTHTLDLRLQQNFNIKLNRKVVGLTITFDVFNFTNMLNRNWGRIYFITNDSYWPIQFIGYANNTTLIPQYQFKPINDPLSLQPSTIPGNSARWISQLGFKINLY